MGKQMRKPIREVDLLFEIGGWIVLLVKWVGLAGIAGLVAGLTCGYSVMP